MAIRITYFVHGTTVDNEKDIATGWNQGELSELGVQQSKDLQKLIGRKKFDAVFCSDLKRAVDSAGLTFGKKYKIIKDKRLRECNYGKLNGKDGKVVKVDAEKHIEKPYPNGESYRDVEKRMRSFLRDVGKRCDGRRIAIVAHQAPQLALDVILKGKSWKHAMHEDWRRTGKWQPGWMYRLD